MSMIEADVTGAIGYDRVSTTRQAREGVMLDARSESIDAYCKLKGWPLLHYFTDPGKSGREGKRRPGFDKAMSDACQPGRVLVVDSLSRFVRSTVDAARALKRLQDAGANLVIVNLGVDTTTASGKLIFTIIAAVAEFESNQIGERVKAAWDFILKTKGHRTHTTPPYGYRRDPATGEHVRIAAEQRVISFIVFNRLKKPRPTWAEVTDALNAAGLKTRTGKKWSVRNVTFLGQRAMRAWKRRQAKAS